MDATIGQNALSQVEAFKDMIDAWAGDDQTGWVGQGRRCDRSG